MEITSSQLYWLTRLDSLETVFAIVLALSTVATLIAGAFEVFCGDDDDTRRVSGSALKVFVPALVLGLLGVVFVPNTEEAAAIWVVPKVANSPRAAELGTNAVNVVNMGLKCIAEKAFRENR